MRSSRLRALLLTKYFISAFVPHSLALLLRRCKSPPPKIADRVSLPRRMDYLSSISKRTRSREAVYLKREWERRKRRNGVSEAGLGECSGGKSEESSGDGSSRFGDSQETGSEKVVRSGEEASRGSDPVLLIEESDGEEVVGARKRVRKGFSDSVGKNVTPMSVDKNDSFTGETVPKSSKFDEEVRFCEGGRTPLNLGGQNECAVVDSVRLDGSFLEKSCTEKDKNVIGISVDKKESSARETVQKSSKFNEELRLNPESQNECPVIDSVCLDGSCLKKRSKEKDENAIAISVDKSKSSEAQNSYKFHEEVRFCVGGRTPLNLGGQNGCTVIERIDGSCLKKGSKEKDKNVTGISVDKNKSAAVETIQESSKFNEEVRFCDGGRTPFQLGDQNNCPVSNTAHTDDNEKSESESSTNDDYDEDYRTDDSHDSESTEESSPYDGDGDNEDTDDADSDSLQESTHHSGYGDDNITNDAEVVDKGRPNRENDDNSQVILKRKKFSGLYILVNPNNTNESSSVAQRTRSHSISGSSKKKKKKKKKKKQQQLGTFSQPICCDEEDTNSSTEEESSTSCEPYDDEDEDDDDDDDCNSDDSDYEEYVKDIAVKKRVAGKAKVKAVPKKKSEPEKPSTRKRVCAPKGGSLFNLFVDTIWEKDGVLQQDLSQSEDDASEKEITTPVLSLNFTFGVEKPTPEKTDYEKQMDILWAEFDFALRSIELGTFGSSMIDTEDSNEPDVAIDPSTLCRQGKHQLILDEQIGIKCSLCSFVSVESKYIFPPIDTYRSERIGRRNYPDEANISTWDGFHFQDATASQGSSLETKGTIWDKFPDIKQKMYPHQLDGFEFMWKNLAGSIELDELHNPAISEGVGGCVISHAPGTGKTLLTIVFLQTYMQVFGDCRPVIMAPCSMLLTWEEEFRKWKVDIPFHNLNAPDFSGKEDRYALKLIEGKPHRNRKWNRIVKLLSWSKGKSILGVSYSLFEKLAGEKFVKDKDGGRREIPRDKEGEDIRKILLEKPSLLVLDEGHTPRNERSRIWKALQNIKTERRIILSGTPFQNNFDELYNTLWLVRPKFADEICSGSQRVCRKTSRLQSKKEARGKWVSLTSSIGKHADTRLLETVRSTIGPFVHVHRGSILQQNLPGLRDCVVVLHPPVLQKQILEEVEEIQNPLELEHVVSLVSVHPSLLLTCNWPGIPKSFIDKISSKGFRLDPNNGVKTRFLMELIKLSETMNEKVLVFSQFIDPFFIIKDQLQAHFNWSEGREVLQMDGKLNVRRRQFLINHFNDPASKVRVLLASTKACREGINLIGASRIVLLDVVWNPSVERQAISRAYRIGQKKVVHTYHLITSGTMEAEKYCRQVEKDRLSNLVFSSSPGNNVKQNSSSMISDDKILEVMVGNENLQDMFEKIISQRLTFD